MIIKKFLHSCLLLEAGGKKLLIDPGVFSFIENKLKPEDVGAVEVILLTHKHWDHYYPPALKTLLALKPATIITHAEIGELLKQEGLVSELIKAGETKEIAGFKITALAAPHGPMPAEIPHNLAFLINDTLLHPGDSLDISGLKQCEVLALPVWSPWARVVEALALAENFRPKKVIPIHDAVVKDYMLERLYQMCAKWLGERGIAFEPLALNNKLEV